MAGVGGVLYCLPPPFMNMIPSPFTRYPFFVQGDWGNGRVRGKREMASDLSSRRRQPTESAS